MSIGVIIISIIKQYQLCDICDVCEMLHFSLTPVMCPWQGIDQFYFINIIMILVSSLSLHRSIHLLYHIGWLIMLFN